MSVRMRVRVWCEGVCWWHLSIAKAAGQHTRLVGWLVIWHSGSLVVQWWVHAVVPVVVQCGNAEAAWAGGFLAPGAPDGICDETGLWLVEAACPINAVSTSHPTLHLDEGRIHDPETGARGSRGDGEAAVPAKEIRRCFLSHVRARQHKRVEISRELDERKARTTDGQTKDEGRVRVDRRKQRVKKVLVVWAAVQRGRTAGIDLVCLHVRYWASRIPVHS